MKKRALYVFMILCILGGQAVLLRPPDIAIAQAEEPRFWVGDPLVIDENTPSGQHDYYRDVTLADDLSGWIVEITQTSHGPELRMPGGFYKNYFGQTSGMRRGYIVYRHNQFQPEAWEYPGIENFIMGQGVLSVDDGWYSTVAHQGDVWTMHVTSWVVDHLIMKIYPVYYGTQSPPPTHETCSSVGVDKSFDVLAVGSVTSGSLTGFDYAQGPLGPIDRIQFHISAPLPNQALGPGAQSGLLEFTVGAPGVYGNMTVKNVTATIGGLEFSLQGGAVSIPGGSTTLEMDFSADVDVIQEWGNPQAQTGYPYVASMQLTYPAVNNGETLICDGGMEQSPNNTWWQGTDPNLYFGRLNTLFDFGQILFNGQPACGYGHQLVGNGVIQVAMPGVATPIYQWFNWDGGTLYYKFRYKSGQDYWLLNIDRGSPNVYLVTEDNVFLRDLYGSNTKDSALIIPEWTLVTGSTFLPQGQYGLVLDQGYVLDNLGVINRNATGHVYYDDVAAGSYAFSVDECSAWYDAKPPDAPTPTPTPTVTRTPDYTTSPVVVTSTLAPTSSPAMKTNTPGPSRTPPWKTSTAGPSPTYRVSRTPTHTAPALTTAVPSITRTPYGTPIPSSTSVPVTPGTATNTPQPLPTSTPGLPMDGAPTSGPHVGTPNPGDGDSVWSPNCIFDPNCDLWPDDPESYCIWHPADPACQGVPVTDKVCDWNVERPGDLDPAKWINYALNDTKRFVCWGDEENATAVAIPRELSRYEPFGTLGEVAQGVTDMRTQAAYYNWSDSGASGVHDPISPNINQLLKGSGPNPWDDNAPIVNFQAGGSGSGADAGYTAFCNSALSDQLSGRLAEGTCYALNQLRRIGYLPWVQFFINIGAIVIMIRMVRIFFEQRLSVRTNEQTKELEYQIDQRSQAQRKAAGGGSSVKRSK